MSRHFAVVLRPVLKLETPPDRFRIDPANHRPMVGLGTFGLGLYERSALEVALQLAEGTGARVTAIAAGPRSYEVGLRKALASGASDALLVETSDLDPLDPAMTASVLACAVERLGDVDVVVAGRRGSDWDTGQVGLIMAERLGWPAIGLVRHAWAEDGELHAVHGTPSGEEHVACQFPAVLTVTSYAGNLLRLSRIPDVFAAARAAIPSWTPSELGLSDSLDELRTVRVHSVKSRRRDRMDRLDGATPAKQIESLAEQLLELTLR
jgi:electron transfer flavoprotein alpha/beta subunit